MVSNQTTTLVSTSNKSNDNFSDDGVLEAVLSHQFLLENTSEPKIGEKYDVSEMILLISTGFMGSSISNKIFTKFTYCSCTTSTMTGNNNPQVEYKTTSWPFISLIINRTFLISYIAVFSFV